MNCSLIGILGGMGPLASAGFVNFLYQKCQTKFSAEQSYPRIILLSDPTIPDRITCITDNNSEKIVISFENNIQKLLLFGVTQILICCFTAHYFLPALASENQKPLIHLGKLLKTYLNALRKNTLILCSKFLAQSRLIDSIYAVYPEEMYFDKIHQLIYKIKLDGPSLYQNELIAVAKSLAKLYHVPQVLFACTEFHLVYQSMCGDFMVDVDNKICILDGLNIAADFIVKEYLDNS